MNRRKFNVGLAAAGGMVALSPFGILRAQSRKLRVGVLLPRSGIFALQGQSCQRAPDMAPGVIRQLMDVDIEIMSADTESNADIARTRAERLIQEGAHVLVGAVDSGQTAAVAQVAEQRGIPHIVNIAAAPQITEQGYKFVFRNFPTAPEIVRNGLSLIGDIFRAANTVPRTCVFMHVNDLFGQSMVKGMAAILPQLTHLPFKIVATISYDPAANDLSIEVAKAKATNADFVLVVTRQNDPILLRREMVKQRWVPMGIFSLGPGFYEEQFFKALGRNAEYPISNTTTYNPKSPITKIIAAEFKKRYSKDELAFHGYNMGFTFDAIMIAADAFRRSRSTDPKVLADAIRQTNLVDRMSLGGPIKFNAKGQVEGIISASIQNLRGRPRLVLPEAFAEAKVVFPVPEYRKA